MFFKRIMLLLLLSFACYPEANNNLRGTEKSSQPSNYNHYKIYASSNNKSYNDYNVNKYTNNTTYNYNHKSSCSKYVVHGAIFGGILFLIYKIFRAIKHE